MKKDLKVEVEIPKGMELEIVERTVKVKGEKGELEERFDLGKVEVSKEEGKFIVGADKATKREGKMIGTIAGKVRNMVKGLKEGFVYKLKICASHFPMTVAVEGNKVVVKNFLGEKIPREGKILEGVEVEIKGEEITVKGIDKEKVGQTTANIEGITRKKGKELDRRVIQDGIYLVEK